MTSHGSYYGYNRQGCRCRECRAANAEYHRSYRRRRRDALRAGRADVEHGTTDAYNNDGCRCEACKKAQAKRWRDYQYRLRGWR